MFPGLKQESRNRGAVAVASDIAQMSFPDEITGTVGSSQSNPLLVAKLIPKVTGEMILKFEGKNAAVASTATLHVYSASTPSDFATTSNNMIVDYRTPLGTTLATYLPAHGVPTGAVIPAQANYTTFSTVIFVHRLMPVYLVLLNTTGGAGGVVGFKNLNICYDLR